MNGRVIAFDEQGGLGTLESTDGIKYEFHCTQIADGTRTIKIGAEVEFEVVPGLLGHWEAAHITPTS